MYMYIYLYITTYFFINVHESIIECIYMYI